MQQPHMNESQEISKEWMPLEIAGYKSICEQVTYSPQ